MPNRKHSRALTFAEREEGPLMTFIHLIVGGGGATLALQRSPVLPGRFYVGISWRSPADRFDRRRGIAIANGRLRKAERTARWRCALAFDADPADGRIDSQAIKAFEAWIMDHLASIPRDCDEARRRLLLDSIQFPRWLASHCAAMLAGAYVQPHVSTRRRGTVLAIDPA